MNTLTSTNQLETRKMMPPLTCKADSILGTVIHMLASKSVHRIYVVSDEDQVMGVITLRDVISCFIFEPPHYFDDYMGFSLKEMLSQWFNSTYSLHFYFFLSASIKILHFCAEIFTARPPLLNLNWILQIPKNILYRRTLPRIGFKTVDSYLNSCFQWLERISSTNRRIYDAAELCWVFR